MITSNRQPFQQIGLFLACLILLLWANSCNKPAQETSTGTAGAKRYHLEGQVVSVDKQAASANVNAKEIPGFMDAMTMPYPIQPASMLDHLAPGDTITADVVVQSDKYWLENVTVTGHAAALVSKPTTFLDLPAPGEVVPDFKLTNQDGKRISLTQYRGKVLLVTFIYTRCPFPDYCPRVSGEFAHINRQLSTDAALYRLTHLLSISIDPKHDNVQALRSYGGRWTGGRKPAVFDHWEFAVPTAAELPQVARFFGLIVEEDGGLITHSLSTAVVGPDGHIFRCYSGSDWKAEDLIKDAASALHATV
jgi:protein SCO1/2